MHYELWDFRSRNLLADFDTEQEALTAVNELLAVNDLSMADDLALVWRDGGVGGAVAEGAALVTLCQQASPERASLPR
ncbi:MAG: hypothetical protein IT306_25245 [Chloroflexi bacterium]|nr:hypothetical protein [Chloroflexota bacterium]